MFPAEIIKLKRNKQELSTEEISYFINGYTAGEIPDYQMSALLMSILLNGMSDKETLDLTQVMLNSGEKVSFDENIFPVDKHSTGGVGDKTSLILAPIVAACGVPVPMMSGRGLGHTGGTLDKLESIPGFKTSLSLANFKKYVQQYGLCFIGQTSNICPADKKIYALRDVTATVESLPLICASIMSKKISEGIKGLVLDVKVGSGAFMKTTKDAEALAKGLISIGVGYGIDTKALITNMDAPLGRFVGNALEVHECLSILKRESFKSYSYKDFSDTEELSLELSAQMVAVGKSISLEEAKQLCTNVLENGKAFETFEKICSAQGGDLKKLPDSEVQIDFFPESSGYLESVNTEKVGIASIALGAGRKVLTDIINPITGICVHKKIGDPVDPQTPLFSFYVNDKKDGLSQAQEIIKSSFTLSDKPTPSKPLILDSL